MEHRAHPLRRSKCKWRGYEGDLIDERRKQWTQRVCPECGCDEYTFMTPGEIRAWERKKAKEQS